MILKREQSIILKIFDWLLLEDYFDKQISFQFTSLVFANNTQRYNNSTEYFQLLINHLNESSIARKLCFSQAFDKDWHSGLCYKIKNFLPIPQILGIVFIRISVLGSYICI